VATAYALRNLNGKANVKAVIAAGEPFLHDETAIHEMPLDARLLRFRPRGFPFTSPWLNVGAANACRNWNDDEAGRSLMGRGLFEVEGSDGSDGL